MNFRPVGVEFFFCDGGITFHEVGEADEGLFGRHCGQLEREQAIKSRGLDGS